MAKRLRSFTILELIITLLISSVVIGIVYYAYLTMTKQLAARQRKSAVINEYYLFQLAINQDMENATAILKAEGTETKPLVFYMQDSIRKEYRFESGVIIRSGASSVDSFRIQATHLRLKKMSDQLPLIRELRLNIQLDDQPFDVVFEKKYTSSELMKPLPNEQ